MSNPRPRARLALMLSSVLVVATAVVATTVVLLRPEPVAAPPIDAQYLVAFDDAVRECAQRTAYAHFCGMAFDVNRTTFREVRDEQERPTSFELATEVDGVRYTLASPVKLDADDAVVFRGAARGTCAPAGTGACSEDGTWELTDAAVQPVDVEDARATRDNALRILEELETKPFDDVDLDGVTPSQTHYLSELIAAQVMEPVGSIAVE